MEIKNFSNTNFKKRKIPRYIYHLTNEHAYKSMCKDGFIKATTKDLYIKEKAIFSIELDNFCKNWGFNKCWEKFPEPLQESLLMLVADFKYPSTIQEKNRLIILRIPTDKLDPKKLFVRSENSFFKCLLAKIKNTNGLRPDLKEHLEANTPADRAKYYKNKGDAIEYVYKDDIPIKDVMRIGNIYNINSLKSEEGYDKSNPVKSILQKCLQGEKEEKAINFLKV